MRALSSLLVLALLAAPAPAIAAPEGVAAAPPPGPAATFDTALTAVTSSLEAGTLTLELKLSKAPAFVDERPGAREWSLFVPKVSAAAERYPLHDEVLPVLEARRTRDGTRFSVPWTRWCPTRIERQADPTRLTITFRKRYQVIESEAVAPGVLHEHWRTADERGPLNVHALRFDPRRSNLAFRPAMAGFFERATPSAIARQNKAFAAVNGGFFHIERQGEPLGLLMLDRKLLAQPVANRAALLFYPDGRVAIDHVQFEPRLITSSGERRRFDMLNEPREPHKAALYNSAYGPSTRTPLGGREWPIQRDGLVGAPVEADAAIPPGGYVISAHGQAAEWLDRRLKVGERVTIDLPLETALPGVRDALGAGPQLVRDGRVMVTAQQERTPEDIRTGIAPRTAVGVTATGEVILLVADGRQPTLSRGLTLDETAQLLLAMGADDAINLDGGGSSAMVIGPGPVNSPSDGVERAVNNAVLLFVRESARK